MSKTPEIVRVLRIVEYTGERSWVEKTVTNSIHGTKHLGYGSISAATIGAFPQVLEEAREIPLMNVRDVYPNAPKICN